MADGQDEDYPRRVSLSRDTLRAELAEMELRLRVYFDEQLQHRAKVADLVALELRVAARERGELTIAQRQVVEEIAKSVVSAEHDAGWTTKERWLAVMSTVTATSMLILSTVLAIHGGSL